MSGSAIAQLSAQARRKLELDWAAEEQRAVELTAAEQYARDPIGWINDHVWFASKFDKQGRRSRVRTVKATLYPDQEATVAAIVDLDHLQATGEVVFRWNVLVEKSRQIGETWLLAALVAWLLHYHQARGLYMHQRAAEVADKTLSDESFFGKIRFIDDHLDRDRCPGLGRLAYQGFTPGPAAVTNRLTGARIRGECKRDDPGRGGTFDYAILDEAAHVDHGEAVHESLDSACEHGKVYLSTPKGNDNVHARLCSEKPHGWTYLRLHWSTHPVYSQGLHVAGQDPDCALCEGNRQGVRWVSRDPKAHRYPGRPTSPWYDLAVIGKTDQAVASELDIDRERSLAGRVYPEFDPAVHVVDDGVPYDPLVKVQLAIDYGMHTTSVVVLQDTVEELRVIGLLEMGDDWGTTATAENVARELRLFLQELGVSAKETLPEFTRYWRGVGDPAGHSRSTTGSIPAGHYRRQGFVFGKPPTRLRRVEVGVSAVKALLTGWPKELRVCGVNAAGFADHMLGHVWPTDSVGQRRQSATEPEDNIHTHCCDAFRYWVVATFPPPAEQGAVQTTPSDDPEPPEHPLTRRRRLSRERHGLEPREGVIDPGFGPSMTL